MDSNVPSSHPSTQALLVNVSGLFGIVIFLYQMLGGASLDHVLFTAVTSGLAAYLALAIGYAAARRIIDQAPAPSPSDDSSNPSSAPAEADVETDEAQSASEPQAA